MTPEPHPDGYYLPYDEAIKMWEYIRDHQLGLASYFWGEIREHPVPTTSAEQVLSITEKDLTLIYDSLLLQEEGVSQIMALEAVERTRQRGRV